MLGFFGCDLPVRIDHVDVPQSSLESYVAVDVNESIAYVAFDQHSPTIEVHRSILPMKP